MEAVTTSLVSSGKVSELKNSAPNPQAVSGNILTDNTAPSFLPEGTVLLERYMLMRVIAQGGASYIYRARDMLAVLGGKEEQSHIAVKVVRNNDASTNANHQLALYEALTTRHLSHENIIKVYDFHRDGDISFVTMELIEGESLLQYVQRLPDKKLPYRFAVSILQAVASALHSAHSQGVVHSDIKPSNILKTESGKIKVIDFATARTLIEQNKPSDTIQNRGEEDAPFYGYTLAYASPDTILDKPASASDDVFSFACITYEILAGKHPYERKPTNTIAKSFRLIKPREVGFWQWQVLKKGLNLDGKERIKSVTTFINLFHHARYFWVYLIASISLLSCVGFLAVNGVIEFQQAQAESTKQAEYYLQNERFQADLERLKTLSPIEQLNQLHILNNYSEAQALSGKTSLQKGIVEALEQRVMGTIAVVEPLQAITEFSELRKMLEVAQGIYPDSLGLTRTLALLNTESSQLRDTNEYALQQAWEKTNFTQQSASEILAAIHLLERSGSTALKKTGPDRAVVETYQAEVVKAVKELDVVSVSKLFEFSKNFESTDEFRSVWRAIDKGYSVAAQEWIDYVASDHDGVPYPRLTMRFYVEPYFQAMNKRIETVWTDKDLIQLKDDFFKGKDKYEVSDAIPIVGETKRNLVEKIENKIKYYRNKNNKRGEGDLAELIADLEL